MLIGKRSTKLHDPFTRMDNGRKGTLAKAVTLKTV
jgi:hypothetical protein